MDSVSQSVSGLVKEVHLSANICMVGQGKRKELQSVNKAPRSTWQGPKLRASIVDAVTTLLS